MRCPNCGSEVRPSKKYPGYYLCDNCRKRYPSAVVVDDMQTEEPVPRRSAPASQNRPSTESAERRTAAARQSASAGQTAPARRRTSDVQGQSAKRRTSDVQRQPAKRRTSDVQGQSTKQRASGRQDESSLRNAPARQTAPERDRVTEPVPKKKGGVGKVLLILLLLLLLAGAVFFSLVYFDFIENPLAGIGPFVDKEESQKGGEDDGSDPLNVTYHVGDTAEYNGISVQVIGYEESTGDDWAAPAEGKVFVFVNIAITNQSEEELPVEKMASFENYCGGEKLDYSANAFTALATNTDRQPMDGSIASGATLNGYLCLEVPADWTTLTVQYANNVWSNDKVTFEIAKSDTM